MSNASDPPRPTSLVSKSGIELLTASTPNGVKASILLEELKAAYGTPYTWQGINIMENIQKEPWFTAVSPNGRIPAIVDHDRGGFAVFEGAAILTYLTEQYDKDYKFSFENPNERSVALQWIAWQTGGLGPMQGQANHFYRFTKERVPYPTQRYVGESERLYGVLDHHLKDREYLAGSGKGTFSIADMASFGWVNSAYFSGVDLSQFPNVEKWWERIEARPAVQKGLSVPKENQLMNRGYQKKLKEDPEFKGKEDDLKEHLYKAQEMYGYKYASP